MPQRVTELHNIMPLANIPLVLQHGILSHEEAANYPTIPWRCPKYRSAVTSSGCRAD